MIYAIRKDGQGWRAVSSANDVRTDEVFSEDMPGEIKLTAKEITLRKIADLEASVTPRRLREAVLGIDAGWLASLNDQIATLRGELSA